MRASIAVLGMVVVGSGCGPSGTLEAVSSSVCASGRQWAGGNAGSPLMNPGQACIACHAAERKAPTFAAAGTVYATLTQANNCAGTADGMKIELTGSDGKLTTLTPNAAGNFYLQGALATPYRAKLISAGGERVMAAAQTSGDCNGCHTVAGLEGAPGRISP